MLKILVLGSGAGGGSPQWNCDCPVCRRVRAGEPGTVRRTQSSIAVSADGDNWFLCNASPDLGQQIVSIPALQTNCDFGRHSPIVGAVLTNGDVDHVTGLLTLRESHPLAVYATGRVQKVLKDNKIFNVLNPDFVDRRVMEMDTPIELKTKEGKASGIIVEPFTVPGKIALWLEDESAENFGSQPEDTIALKISSADGASSFFYMPGCAEMPPELADRLTGAELVFFDGTLWNDDEMKENQVGIKTGDRMGHMSNSGPDGTISCFEPLGVKRKIFIHINNTNPILLEDSPQRKEAESTGWEVSYDGMEITL